MIENEDHEITVWVQHTDNIVHCGEPEIVDVSRERFEAHLSAKPIGDPGNVKLSIAFRSEALRANP